MTYEFQFPENARAKRLTVTEQSAKIVEEALEAKVAAEYGEGVLRVCEEAFDAIVAAENLVRKMPRNIQDLAYGMVLRKNAERGDWDA